MTTKTREEIEALKRNWYNDSIWDIEETEGFEEYYDELKIYRLECESMWAEKHQAVLLNKSVQLGFPGNVRLAEYIDKLERKVQTLENEINVVRNAINENDKTVIQKFQYVANRLNELED